MKIRNLSIIGLSALLFVTAGCGTSNGGKASSLGGGSSSVPPALSSSSASAPGASSEAASSDSAAPSSQPESSAPAGGASFQTRQDVLSQVRTALKTKVPLLLPTDVPVDKGRFLTAATAAQTTDYKVDFYETDRPAQINSQEASKGTPVAAVEGTQYRDAATAKDAISGYEQADISNYGELVDLGHGIKAVADAGLGHQQLIWNEGRWCLRIDGPTDSAFRNKKYPDRDQLAKNVVAYLEDHMLPAPQKIGVVSIGDWNQNDGTTIEWQENLTVYRIESKDPMTALQVAVAMK